MIDFPIPCRDDALNFMFIAGASEDEDEELDQDDGGPTCSECGEKLKYDDENNKYYCDYCGYEE